MSGCRRGENRKSRREEENQSNQSKSHPQKDETESKIKTNSTHSSRRQTFTCDYILTLLLCSVRYAPPVMLVGPSWVWCGCDCVMVSVKYTHTPTQQCVVA